MSSNRAKLQKKKLGDTISPAEKYFRRYLSIGPLGLALWRSVEARHLAKVKLKRPILDIGCGFGEFAQAFADEPIDMGIDNNNWDLYIASKTNKYKNLTLADAADLPFPDNTFASAFSISTFEHIKEADKALKEAYRVLKPGGILFLTIESDEVEEAVFYTQFLKKIGLPKVAKIVRQKYNTLFHRLHILPKNEWIRKVEKAGFIIDKRQDIISKKVNWLYDIFLITAWPSQIVKLITGKRSSTRPKFVTEFFVKKFLKYVEEEEKEGTNLLIIARKKT